MTARARNLSRNGKAARRAARRKRYRFHPLCLLFPRLGDQDLQELAEDSGKARDRPSNR
jgi:hypothetical protein